MKYLAEMGCSIWMALLLTAGAAAASHAEEARAVAPADPATPAATQGLRFRVGGGNLVTHLTGAPAVQMYQALNGVGARLARMNSYGWRDLQHRPTPTNFDAGMMEAYRHGITPIILLEYEGSYQFLSPPQMIGTREEWAAAGEAYARRFRPNGEWGRENGIRNWGVTIYTAINEPDVQGTIPKRAYHDALQGFAEGVHKVDPALKVVPGGFARCNSHGDATLGGYGPAISDLLDDGVLDGIDLHTYYNARWFPLDKGREFSAQRCFDKVKAQLGASRDIGFYSTEYNVTRDGPWEDTDLLAGLFLTAFWDEMGVVGDDGATSVTRFAFPWNLGDTGRFEGPGYAMATAENPWKGDKRSDVLKRVLDLAGDMHFTRLDPKGSGTFDLEGPSGALRVWQDRPGWTDKVATEWTLDSPPWASEAELWTWRGRAATGRPQGGRVHFDQLTGHDTYMVFFPRKRT